MTNPLKTLTDYVTTKIATLEKDSREHAERLDRIDKNLERYMETRHLLFSETSEPGNN